MGYAQRAMCRERLVTWVLLLGIFAIGMTLRLHNVDAESLWLDEVATANWSRLDLPSLVATIGDHNDPPLLYLVTRMFTAISTDGEFVLRLPAVLFGSLSILLAYKAGETLWSSHEGLLGASLLAVNAYHVRYSQEARHYALMVFLALLSLILLLKALQKGQKRLWLGFAVATSLSLYNHAFAFLVLLAEAVYAVWILRHDWLPTSGKDSPLPGSSSQVPLHPARRSLMFVLSLFLIALSYLPWLQIFWTQASRHLASSPTAESPAGPLLSLAFLREVILTFSAGIGSGHLWVETASASGFLLQEVPDIAVWQALAVLVFVALFLCGLVGCGSERLMLVLPWFATPFVLLCFVSTKRFLHVRYVLYILPLYLLLIARGTVRLSRVLSKRPSTGEVDRRRLLALTVAPALLLGLVSLEPLARYYSSHKEDWRGVARYLKDNLASHDIVLADGKAYRPTGDDGRVIGCLSYYLPSVGARQAPIIPVRPVIWRHLERIEHSDGNIWMVLWYPERPATWDSVKEVTVVDFQDVAVLRLREPSGNTLRDTLRALRVLLNLLPVGEAHFDVHLALADVYLRTGNYYQASLEIDMADEVQPNSIDASRDLAEARAKFRQLSRAVQDMQNPLWRGLGESVALLGYDMHQDSVRSGGSLRLTLWWQALAKMDKDYSLFIHLVGHGDRIWAQEDELLQHDGLPTSAWEVGEMAEGSYQLEIDPDIPAGDYTVKLGIYDWETGERLPVWDERGARVVGDSVLLTTIGVNQ